MMRKTLLGFALMLCAAMLQAGDALSLKTGHLETYVVKKGDTLWGISEMFLEDPWLWPELWYYNAQVDNPHLIYPGDFLKLRWVNGRPTLVKDNNGGVVKLNPQMRISDLNDAIPPISLDAIAPFLTRSRVVDPEELDGAPYVLAGRNGNIVAGAGDQVLGRGDFSQEDSYGIYRAGQLYRDPITGEVLGIAAKDIGTANLLSSEGEISTLELSRSTEEIRRADRFLPLERYEILARFDPKSPTEDVDGFIIAVEDGVSQIGSLDVVTLNLGGRNQLVAGDVMAIYTTGVVVRDPLTNERLKAPDVRAGILMVFRTFEKTSYALVLKAEQALKVGDRVSPP